MKRLFCLLVLSIVYLTSLQKGVCEELNEYSLFEINNDEELFSSFRRLPEVVERYESTSYLEGKQCLKSIEQYYPEILDHSNLLKEIDSIGHPEKYHYGNYGEWSPTTLQNMALAAKLFDTYGKTFNQMRILEIGGGYGGLCKIIKTVASSASYSILSNPENTAFIQRYLTCLGVNDVNLIDINEVQNLQDYDLVIDNRTDKYLPESEHDDLLHKVVKTIPNGYLCVDQEEGDQVKRIHHLMRVFSNRNQKVWYHKKAISEFSWKVEGLPIAEKVGDPQELLPRSKYKHQKAITYGFSGGRLGDNLMTYLHTKWLSMKYGIQLLYKPFKYSNYFELSKLHQPLEKNKSFKRKVSIVLESQLTGIKDSTLITVPYFPDCKFEYDMLKMVRQKRPFFYVDWRDEKFLSEVRKSLQPTVEVELLQLPKDKLTVAIHVRRGGSYESYELCEKNYPLKFPPDDFYIAHLKKIAEIYEDTPIYVYLFTDDEHPQKIVEKYKKALKNDLISFDWSKGETDTYRSDVINDFFSMTQFDCLIRSTSNFSAVAAKMTDYLYEVKPTHGIFINGKLVIDEEEVYFNPKTIKK